MLTSFSSSATLLHIKATNNRGSWTVGRGTGSYSLGGKGNTQPGILSGTWPEVKSSWARGWPDTNKEKGLGYTGKRSMFLLRYNQ